MDKLLAILSCVLDSHLSHILLFLIFITVGRPFASKILNSKIYNQRFDVLHKTLLRAAIKNFSNLFKDFAKQKRSKNKSSYMSRRNYNRNTFTYETFQNLIKEFTTERIFQNWEFKSLTDAIDVNLLELYTAVLADKKLVKQFYRQADQKREILRFYDSIDNYTQSKFLCLLKTAELRFLLNLIMSDETMEKLFKSDPKFSKDPEKFKEGFKKLKEFFDT
jgi:hypothetical protein